MKNTAAEILKHKVYTLDALKDETDRWKANYEKIVFTNGVFDLMHIGHLSYLAEAASLGTKLIVGLNSDASTKRLKGPTRPVNDEHSRATMLAALFFISAVVIFEEDTPLNVIQTLMPQVLVKGGDYTIDQIVGADEVLGAGGDVRTIQFIDGYSSSLIIKKIQEG